MMDIWNNTKHKKEEESLPDYARYRTHLILGKNKDGTLKIWMPQLPIDVLPVFPFFNAAVTNAFKLKNGEFKSAKKAAQDTVERTLDTSWKQAEYLLTPFYRFFKGVASNTDPITKRKIVPYEEKVNAKIWTEKMGQFFLTTFSAPIAMALRAERQLEYTPDDSPYTTAKKWGKQWLNLGNALGFYNVDPSGLKDKMYQAKEKAERDYNSALYRYVEDFSQKKARPLNFYLDLAKESGLIQTEADKEAFTKSLIDIRQNPVYLRLRLEEQLRHTAGENDRKLLKQQIEYLKNKHFVENIKATKKGARGAALREFVGE
jgi:hypothetical protein